LETVVLIDANGEKIIDEKMLKLGRALQDVTQDFTKLVDTLADKYGVQINTKVLFERTEPLTKSKED
jgi:hypothetical protein